MYHNKSQTHGFGEQVCLIARWSPTHHPIQVQNFPKLLSQWNRSVPIVSYSSS